MKMDAVQLSNVGTATVRAMPAIRASGQDLPDAGKLLPQDAAALARETQQAVESIDRFLREAGRQFSFFIDDATGHTVVAIHDPATGELIRQIPSEEVLRIARNLEIEGPALIREWA